jgi:hypothetical protein
MEGLVRLHGSVVTRAVAVEVRVREQHRRQLRVLGEDLARPRHDRVARRELEADEQPRPAGELHGHEHVVEVAGLARTGRARAGGAVGGREVVVDQRLARADHVVVAGCEQVRHDAVERVQAARSDVPLRRYVLIDDVAGVHDERDAARRALLDDPLRLALEDLRIGAGVELRVGQNRDRERAGRAAGSAAAGSAAARRAAAGGDAAAAVVVIARAGARRRDQRERACERWARDPHSRICSANPCACASGRSRSRPTGSCSGSGPRGWR